MLLPLLPLLLHSHNRLHLSASLVVACCCPPAPYSSWRTEQRAWLKRVSKGSALLERICIQNDACTLSSSKLRRMLKFSRPPGISNRPRTKNRSPVPTKFWQLERLPKQPRWLQKTITKTKLLGVVFFLNNINIFILFYNIPSKPDRFSIFIKTNMLNIHL